MKIIFKESSEVQLRHPVTDEPLFADAAGKKPLIAEIYGKHTKAYKNAFTKMLRVDSKRNKTPSAQETAKRGMELLTACVVGFKNLENLETENGKVDPTDIAGTLESVFWIKDQVDQAIVDLENFSEASKTI